jgi:oxygen-independent coproporphyrinogen-3 oxidase
MRTLTHKAALPRPRDALNEFGLYVHVPFCSHRCWYCDFNAYADLDHLAAAYMEALAVDIRSVRSAPRDADLVQRPPVTSVFIGGGTPSLVEASGIASVMDAIRDSWDLVPSAEVTIECNPESLDAAKLDAYLEAGINRVSIGVQSLDATSLERLGRLHSAQRALDALALAQARGFERVSGDLIFGIPGEADDQWRSSVGGVLATGVKHVSCYGLTYEEGTPLESWRKLGKVIPVSDDDAARRWEMADAALHEAGLPRYEISNWGDASIHNALYWACGEYLGLGAGAHSHLATPEAAVRSWTLRSPERYIRAVSAGESAVAGSEPIDERTRAAEAMILGLRRTDGVSAAGFESVVGRGLSEVFSQELEEGQRSGVLSWDGVSARITKPLLANAATVLFA